MLREKFVSPTYILIELNLPNLILIFIYLYKKSLNQRLNWFLSLKKPFEFVLLFQKTEWAYSILFFKGKEERGNGEDISSFPILKQGRKHP